MQIPPIPPSVRTSAAGFAGAVLGWIAVIPGVHPAVAAACGFLSMLCFGGGLHLAADARALKVAAESTARVCATCGRPTLDPPESPPAS
jgi:hypothetical protein